jgi:predicted dehydrogenase
MAWAVQSPQLGGEPGAGMRLAVAGASHWHLPRHAANLQAAGARFVAVSDPDPAVAQKWAGELGAPAVADAETIVRAKPDAVLALGRVSDMAEQARFFLESGLSLLAEKPLGLSPQEVAPLLELADRRKAWVSVALVNRYDPLWALLDRLERDGQLGTLAHAHVRIVNGPPQRYTAWGSGWMLDPATAGGGALLNLGIHGMDFARHLAGEPLRVAGAVVASRAHGLPVEDFGSVALQSPSAFAASVEAGYTYPDSAAGMTRSGDNETRVAATGAYVIGRDAEVTLVTPQAGDRRLPDLRAGDRYRDWAFDSLARLRAGQPPVTGIRECLEAVRLVFDAYAVAGADMRMTGKVGDG